MFSLRASNSCLVKPAPLTTWNHNWNKSVLSRFSTRRYPHLLLSAGAYSRYRSIAGARRPQIWIDVLCPRRFSAANPPHVAAAVDRQDGKTDGRTDTRPLHRPCSAYCVGSVKMTKRTEIQKNHAPVQFRSQLLFARIRALSSYISTICTDRQKSTHDAAWWKATARISTKPRPCKDNIGGLFKSRKF